MVPGFWKPKVRVGIKFNECVLLAETQTLHGALHGAYMYTILIRY